MRRIAVLSIVALLSQSAALAEFKPAEHPFLLWTRGEAAAIRKRVQSEPWARDAYQAMLQEKGLGQTFRNLFRIVVMGDDAPAETEKKYLLSLIGNDPRKFKGDTGGGRHYDQYLSVLRYDALYDRLSETERKGLQDTFRDFIKHHCEEETLRFTRTSWLPNMQWPRPMTAHLMALALRDEKLIRQCFASSGGWKYYFDDYLADGRFYGEEFGKQYSMIGEMFLWCRGCERLGLDELGYGYTGRGGATMRRYVRSVIEIGYPRIDIPGGLAHYGQVTMGDARGSSLAGAPPYAFQKSIVDGFLRGGSGGNRPWIASNMNGRDHRNAKVDKLLHPHWFELACDKWPQDRYDYFLAQMRGPGQKLYTPSLFWGCERIDPAKVSPPPAESFVAPERGFAFLRAEQSPAYWESPAPAVAVQFATYYVHYAHDCFSLLGLVAFNRPIYLNRQISNGYGGGCLWTDSARGHASVMVDNLHHELAGEKGGSDHPHWPNPVGPVPVRHAFDDLVKFVAARGRPAGSEVSLDNRQPLGERTLSLDLRRNEPEVWPGVDLERGLFLTREYLCDVFRLSSDRPRLYQWHVHALGLPRLDESWKATGELDERLYDLSNRAIARRLADPIESDRYRMKDVRKLSPGRADWTATIVQTCTLDDVEQSVLGRAWYERRVGVRVHVLGEEGTTVFAGRCPESRPRINPADKPTARQPEKNKGELSELANEVGGTTLMVERRVPSTVFAALHEPFEQDQPRIESFTLIRQSPAGIAMRVTGPSGSSIDDRILLRYWPDCDQPLTLEGGGESFTFADRAFIRIGPDKVEVSGDLRAMRLKVPGPRTLVLNGRAAKASCADGLLVFKGS